MRRSYHLRYPHSIPSSKGRKELAMAHKPKTIMVIEDEPETAEMFAEMMRISGFTVLKSEGGTAALTQIVERKPDAIVMDLMMPDLTGYEIIRFLRRDPQLCQIPVVVVSSRDLPEDIKLGMDAGASFYLTKPVTFQELRAAVDQAVQARL